VKGALGYVYNAHLDRYSDLSNGPVHAGDIIGYVGWTGDAYGGVYHDHFEWHPYATPSADSWPKSIYGYSVIDTGSGTPAVNPYPLLEQVC
jgi:murein DD-endopeptidase MepM/ murein hydrolase activator NlpD